MSIIKLTTIRPIYQAVVAVMAIAIIISCAQQRPLTGGEKDTTPPKVLASSPVNFTKNFEGQTIAFQFDEYVQVTSLSSELVVSPPLKKTPSYVIKGKKLIFTLKDTLLPNTTYNFNFGEAIVDYNEGNPLDSNLWVFSTGNSIDSGLIEGHLNDAYTGKAVGGATVMLFASDQDSIIENGGPMYVTKTTSSGSFSLPYLKDIEYKILAVEIAGPNFTAIPFENIAFYPGVLKAHLDDSEHGHEHEHIELKMFKETDTTQYLSKEVAPDYYAFIIGYHADLVDPIFTFSPTADTFDYYIEELAADSFKFWVSNDIDLDSVTLKVKDKKLVDDTITIDLPSRKDYYKKLKKKDRSIPKTTIKLSNTGHHYFDTLFLKYSRPMKEFVLDSMLLVAEDDTTSFSDLINAGKLKLPLNFPKQGNSEELKSIPILYDWQPSTKYKFVFYPGATRDIINLTNDTLVLQTTTKAFEDYGSFRLNINVSNYNKPLLIELLDEKGKTYKTFYSSTGVFSYHQALFVPGKYGVRLTLDENGNKKWDTGSLQKRTLPEQTIYYNGTIEIRPNWDMEETWNVNLE